MAGERQDGVELLRPGRRACSDTRRVNVWHGRYYVFAWEGQDGGFVEKHARFSFVFRRTPTGDWEIVDHHSSLVPKAPAGLRKATTVLPR